MSFYWNNNRSMPRETTSQEYFDAARLQVAAIRRSRSAALSSNARRRSAKRRGESAMYAM
jgi:hypothetical protein